MNEININGKRITAPDGCSVAMIGDKVFINRKEVDDISKIESRVIKIEINGNIEKLETSGSVTVKGNIGNIDCGGSCNVGGDVNGNINAGGSVRCKNVSGDINCGGSVHKGIWK